MPLTIRRGDVTVLVEGEDAIRVLQHLGMLAPIENGKPTPPQPTPPSPAQKTLGFFGTIKEADADRFRRFYRQLTLISKQVLLNLYDAPEGLADVDLKKTLEDREVESLAGPMTGIVKGAKKVGLDVPLVLEKEKLRDRERGGYFFYKLGPLARAVLREMGKEAANTSKE